MLKLLLTLTLLAFSALGQAPAPAPVPAPLPAVTLPTYIGGFVAFNQIGQPRWNLSMAAIYPVVTSAGIYMSTSTDIIPIQQVDPITKRTFWAFSTSIRQGAHKVVLTSGKFTALVGGDAGVGITQASPSGINVGFAGSFTATAAWELNKNWAVVMPIRALWTGQSSWNVIPEIGILFKP